jgi:hypothetical protein
MSSFIERWNEGVERLRAQRDAVLAEREAEAQAEREAAEQSACRTIRPTSLVDPAVAEAARETGGELLILLRRWQDSLHKHEAVEREVTNWAIFPIETDDDLDRSVALRIESQGFSQALTHDGRKRLSEKISELDAAISDAKARGFFSMAEPVFKTDSLFADSLFNQHRCHRVSNRNEKFFVLALDSLAASDPKTAQRVVDLFTACGAGLFPGEFGPSIVLEVRENIVGTNPIRMEYGAPSGPAIDGFEIVKDTVRATEWRERQEAERQREETARQEAEQEAARREHEMELSRFRQLLAEAKLAEAQQTQPQQQPQQQPENV